MIPQLTRGVLAGKSHGQKKNNNKVESFSTSFLMSTLTCITKKELERVIKIKEDEFHFDAWYTDSDKQSVTRGYIRTS